MVAFRKELTVGMNPNDVRFRVQSGHSRQLPLRPLLTQSRHKQICGCMRVIYANFRWLSRSQRNIVPLLHRHAPAFR
jgi:hypothetical protein